MDNNRAKQRPNSQKKYRQAQRADNLVRYELVVEREDKVRFEAAVAAVAESYDNPWDMRRRLAKARRNVFKEITQGVTHDFYALKDEIEALKEEIKVLTPNFFLTETQTARTIPKTIQALPDDVEQLKLILAKLYSEGQQAKADAKKFKEASDRDEKLHYAIGEQNQQLEAQIESLKSQLADLKCQSKY